MYLTDIRGFTSEHGICLYRFDLEELLSGPANTLLCGPAPALLTFDGKEAVIGLCNKSLCKKAPFCRDLVKIRIHGMGMLGDKGLTHHFARFCTENAVTPRFFSLSDACLSFFTCEDDCERVLEALCEYFPIWV